MGGCGRADDEVSSVGADTGSELSQSEVENSAARGLLRRASRAAELPRCGPSAGVWRGTGTGMGRAAPCISSDFAS